MMDQTPFSREFQILATNSKKPYKQLAREMRLSPALLARVISGTRPPSAKFVERCIKVFALDQAESDKIRHLAQISQDKITIIPRDFAEAEKIVAFVKEMRAQDILGQENDKNNHST